MDHIDRDIIGSLAQDARRSLADVGARVGLAASSVNDRVRRMVAEGTIRRFTVDADPARVGAGVLAILFLALRDGSEPAFRAFAATHPAIVECHHVTGPWSYLMHLRLPDLSGLEPFLDELKSRGLVARTETLLALSSLRSAPHAPPLAPADAGEAP